MKHVLFVCHHNAGRSQMAEAFFNRFAPADVRAESAGTNPAGAVWPEVVEVMAERGFDLRGVVPTKLTVEMQLRADWAVAMGCGDTCPYVPTPLDEWDIPDPAGRDLAAVGEICDTVERAVKTLIATKLQAIRDDRSPRELWLRQLLPSLDREFDSIHSPDAIRRCADDVLEQFENARVRSFVVALAQRQARERLSEPISA